jgi:tetratricopeptide (TPR) repeat protein
LLTLVAVVGLGALIHYLPGDWSLTTDERYSKGAEEERTISFKGEYPIPEPVASPVFDQSDWRGEVDSARVDPDADPAGHAQQLWNQQLKVLFEHGVMLLQQRQYSSAVQALQKVLQLAPAMPEAHVNMGFALLELGDHQQALAQFMRAIDLNPMQANAYYGAGTSYEALRDLELALGAMRSFIHLASGNEHFVVKAHSAIWEWETQLARAREGDQQPVSAAAPSGTDSLPGGIDIFDWSEKIE